LSELDPISQAILDYIQTQPDYIKTFRMIYAVHRKLGVSHSGKWYFRRLVCLALEGRIEAQVNRAGKQLHVRFRRLQENGLEGIPGIEEASAHA